MTATVWLLTYEIAVGSDSDGSWQVHDILTSRTHLPSQGPGAAAGGAGEGDTTDGPALGLGAPSWIGYGPRPYGYPAMYAHPFPPPHLGVPHPPPTNITKL